MNEPMSLTRSPLSTGLGGLSESMFVNSSSPSPKLTREELDRLRTALRTESALNFDFPRLYPNCTSPNTPHPGFRCLKLVKKSPRTSLLPQDDWLKLIDDQPDPEIGLNPQGNNPNPNPNQTEPVKDPVENQESQLERALADVPSLSHSHNQAACSSSHEKLL
ncbi:hypothetical protein CROQUDRAFT_654528 [Cronartium quercuum f. sp. fusiforme G11]|uniref:Uncharacterized protein n=1 Tax=Cronartium quercuum f. sp. fusiforme G11 TaxID=708437 RepID=A0A9P6NKH5_9BASI|nr:hypothetical protein CROQUDRAFT_654528 [Cronartium quercuum f. sp. fusiforme G11]